MQTVKLIASSQNPRAKLYKALIAKTDLYEVVGSIDKKIDKQADFNIYFDTNLLETTKAAHESLKNLIELKEKGNSITIFDVSNNYFNNEEVSPQIVLNTVCAGFVTCSSPYIQEMIYEHTGRLSTLLEYPILLEHFSIPEPKTEGKKEELNILWYGSTSEIFSIRPYQVRNKHLNIVTVLETETSRRLEAAIKRADVIFLPKTFSDEHEHLRVAKVQECLLKGKFVIAPDLEFDEMSLSYSGSLEEGLDFYTKGNSTEWVESLQNTLKEKEGYGPSLEQLHYVFKEAPNDQFFDELESMLNQEEIKI